jgi:hypothetical protein
MALTLNDLFTTNEEFLNFLKSRTHLYHQSNVFFRDFQYGLMSLGETKGKKIRYDRAEELAKEIVSRFEQAGTLRLIQSGSWMLNYPAFKKPSTKTEAATKPGSGPAVAKNAIATPSSGFASPTSTATA